MATTMDRSSNEMIKGAAILTIAAIFSKILSALYRVPFQNIVGDTGFYIYQQVYPFYGIMLALCTYAFPVMISKIIAEKRLIDSKKEVMRVLKLSFLFLTVVGVGWFMFLRFGAETIALWMGDRSLAPLISLMAYPFLLLPILSASKGWFQAHQNMVPSAFSQALEQLVRVVAILGFSIGLMSIEASLYDVGKGAVFGSVVGAIAGVVILMIYMKKQGFTILMLRTFTVKRSDWRIFKQLTITGSAIGMGSMMLVLYQLMDALNVYALLVSNGMGEEEAKVVKGVYDRGQPLVQMGVVVATSLSLTIVPMVTAAFQKQQIEVVIEKARLALKIALLFGGAAAVGLMNIIKPLNIMLFQDAVDSEMLAVYVFAVLFASIILSVSAVLQGMGDFHFAAWAIVVSLAIKYGANQLLVPRFETLGAAVATLIALLFVLIVVMWRLRKKVGFLLDRLFYLRLVTGLIGMTLALQFLFVILLPFDWTSSRTFSSLITLIGVVIGAWLFFYLTWRKGLFTTKEVGQIPLGKKLERMFGEIN
ncbi:putative polysaccharide biosynthesis protein [Jeotgalibacillus marinus]|uniref:Polysaccharide biosynthesis protein n=1 Tax=Jeotgalibacillus marinus TaxID=86667 RepID=A0ABV3Q6F1_9BACL